MLAPGEKPLELAAARCREASASMEFAGLDALLPDAPRDEEGWFDLLSKYDQDREAVAALMRMKIALPAELSAAGVKIERYAILKALPVAAARISSIPLPDTVRRLYATLCEEMALREPQWESHFDMKGDPERFFDAAQLATLRRFPAGVLNFARERLAPLRVMLCVHPLSLPGYLYHRIISMPYTKPAIGPHINFGRKGSLVLLKKDYERALWLIAKTVEMNPEIGGINGSSWFHSQATVEVYPHLAWMRATLSEGGAYIVDTHPADPSGYGFGHNSRKRQILYAEGKFCPRQTAFFWPRYEFLDWASRHPEFAPEGEEPVRAPKGRVFMRVKSPKPARHAKHNSSITLWNGRAALNRFGQFRYIALVLGLPALILSSVAFLISAPWIALLMIPIGIYLAFAFQYFFSQ